MRFAVYSEYRHCAHMTVSHVTQFSLGSKALRWVGSLQSITEM